MSGFIGLAQVIDVATASNALSAVEEMFEFNAGLALVFYVVRQAYNSWFASSARLPGSAIAKAKPPARLIQIGPGRCPIQPANPDIRDVVRMHQPGIDRHPFAVTFLDASQCVMQPHVGQ
jgi:hypothetical protein